MKYDAASKVILDISKEAILRRFLNFGSDIIYTEKLPEETVSLKRSDFPLRVILKDGRNIIVLIEIQTIFDQDFVIRLLDYTARFMLNYHQDVIPFAISLVKSPLATGTYENEYINFRYHVVRLWEEQSKDFLDEILLYPFLPLMNGGEDIIEEIEKRIYESSDLKMIDKADLLTAMAIFAGLKSKDLAVRLIERRRDIMIQSAAYEIIKEEGLKEGLKEGIYQTIAMGLEIKFGTKGLALIERIRKLESLDKLEIIKEAIKITDKLDEIEKLI
jgi:hypothetical protein